MSGAFPPPNGAPSVSLVARKTIKTAPGRLFDAWTRPDLLLKWWGPQSVTCVGAEVDLRVGGRYRIGNRFPDGKTLWITGVFQVVQKPKRLVYTWGIEPSTDQERVTVRFEGKKGTTEVTVIHENISSSQLRDGHEKGWKECLDGLALFLKGDKNEGKSRLPRHV